jgi:hypothetical protein
MAHSSETLCVFLHTALHPSKCRQVVVYLARPLEIVRGSFLVPLVDASREHSLKESASVLWYILQNS